MAYDWQKQRKDSTYEKILKTASDYLRRQGLQGASVANVMKAAGLTVGGFYAHFSSKEDLVKRAFERMADEVKVFVDKLPGKSGKERAAAFMEYYLNPEHRDKPEISCPVAALAGEIGRESLELRKLFSEKLEELMKQRLTAFQDKTSEAARERMLAVMSTYVGALILSRATRGTKLSDEILSASKKFLLKHLEKV